MERENKPLKASLNLRVMKNAWRRHFSSVVQLRTTTSVRKVMMKDKNTFSHGFYKRNPGDSFLVMEDCERHMGKPPAD